LVPPRKILEKSADALPPWKNPSDPMPVRGVLETETDQELLKI